LPRLIGRLPNRHTKANDLVHDFDSGQDFPHLGVVIPQAQFRSDELLEAIHGSLSFRTLMIAGVLFPLFQLTGFERFDGFVAGMTFLPLRGVLSRRDGDLGSLLFQQGVTLFGVISAVGTDLYSR